MHWETQHVPELEKLYLPDDKDGLCAWLMRNGYSKEEALAQIEAAME